MAPEPTDPFDRYSPPADQPDPQNSVHELTWIARPALVVALIILVAFTFGS